MNPPTPHLRLPWLSLGLLLLLLALAPLAMSFPPCPAYRSTDSLQPRRIALVLLGLTATVAALAEFVALARQPKRDILALASFTAVFLACAVVGWRSYPYWVMGVYQVSIGTFPPMDQDPKGLIPMTWIGDLWRLPVLLLYLLCYIAVPTLAVAVIVAFWKRRLAIGIVMATCLSIILIFMLGFCPNYFVWLMD